jgi:hypothetical protein
VLLQTDLSYGFNLQSIQSSIVNTISNTLNTSKYNTEKINTDLLFPDLEKLIVESNNGIDDTNRQEIKDLMIRISESRNGDQRNVVSGQWELVYTTEKEINFFKTSWPFATVSSITQTLDVRQSKQVQNYINFNDNTAQFAVTGTVQAVDNDDDDDDGRYDRIAFEFTTATALVWGKSLSLPPTGAGWFDTMFCNDQYRLSRDSRGDWSVFRRIDT